MFLWLKVKGIEDTKDLIERKAVKKEVSMNVITLSYYTLTACIMPWLHVK